MTQNVTRRTRRPRQTRASVRLADRLAQWLITVGGIGTILAVSVLCVFLVWVVVPLFLPPRLEERGGGGPLAGDADPALGLDSHGRMGWSCDREGELVVFRAADGEELQRRRPLGDERPTAMRASVPEGRIVFGTAEGELRIASVVSRSTLLGPDEVPAPAPAPGAAVRAGSGLVEQTSSGEFKRCELDLSLSEAIPVAPGHPLRLVDAVEATTGPVIASLADDGVLRVQRGTRQTNMLSGEETLTLENGELALDVPPRTGAPLWLGITGLGDSVFLVWEDGAFWRCDASRLGALRVVEKSDLVTEPAARVTALEFLLGRASLAVADSSGSVSVWFRCRPPGAGTPDGIELVRAHELPAGDVPVSAMAASARRRLLAAGYADGSVRLFHVTTANELLQTRSPALRGPIQALALAPEDDALMACAASGRALWELDVRHPETSMAALFSPQWYEGYPAPAHVWQSTGSSDSEPKLGLWPLVFGTLKATVYSLLFGVPLALLAAVYTSEFLKPSHKARIKPTIEMMASLPSVVLGFLSALIVAPLIAGIVPGILVALALLPLCACLGGHLWRLLPSGLAARLEHMRLLWVALILLLGLHGGAVLGPLFERVWFLGDFRRWLAGREGPGTGGWMILLTPVVAAAGSVFVKNWVHPWLLRACEGRTRQAFALLDLAKFALAVLAGGLVLWALAAVLTALGLDPRGGVLDTYVQNNALVVGFVMGFAIIPIVYTISEDALSAVPDHLRAASLGAGATPWQTAVRIVLPTAMSGIFSAVMIGFGRAVGETMIVLMAAGNTPVLDWNVFNGFRTLSANIATELPEAVQGSTHYRALFFSALVLFGITAVLNTAAELVRQRYRRRRAQL